MSPLPPSSSVFVRRYIPELEEKQQAPKATILRKAMEYIRHMQELEQVAEAELVAEKRWKLRLIDRLKQVCLINPFPPLSRSYFLDTIYCYLSLSNQYIIIPIYCYLSLSKCLACLFRLL